MNETILVLNSGSSSLKFGFYSRAEASEDALIEGELELESSDELFVLTLSKEKKPVFEDCRVKAASLENAFGKILDDARDSFEPYISNLKAIGHRLVHGGPNLLEHQVITPGVLKELNEAVHFAPLHLPPALKLIEGMKKKFPDQTQYICLDTVFHRSMDRSASQFPIPEEIFELGIRKYGFHGISYESILAQLPVAAGERRVVGHLGSGASLAAILDGKSVDTTMGLTPTGGIPMGTRSGDLDPGLLLFLLRGGSYELDSLEQMVNKKSGLFALSGGVSDMRELQKKAGNGDEKANLAIKVFQSAVAKAVAALATEIGGLDLLVFTGGIGEKSSQIRRLVAERLKFLGIEIDDKLNQANAPTISSQQSSIRVLVLKSEEEKQIARHGRRILRASALDSKAE